MATDLERLQEIQTRLAQPEPSEEDRLREIQQRMQEAPQPSEGMASDFIRGARRSLVQNTTEGPGGIPGLLQRYVTDPTMALVGQDMPAMREEIGKRYQEQTGINPKAKPGTYSEAFGEAAPGVVRDTAAMIAAGPGMAAIQGPSLIARIIRGAGEFAQARPVGTAVGMAASVPGAQVGSEVVGAGGKYAGEAVGGETGGKIGEAVGNVAGGLVGGVITGMPGQAIGSRIPGSGGFGGPRGIRTEMGNLKRAATAVPVDPFLDRGASPQGAQVFAEQQAERNRIGVDNDIQTTIDNVTGRLSAGTLRPQQVVDEFNTAFRALDREQAAIVDGMWQRAHVHDNAPIDPTPVLRAASDFEPLIDTNPMVVPRGTMDRLYNLGTYTNASGRVEIRPISLKELLELRSSILHDERIASAGSQTTAPNPQLARNLRQLDDAIMEAIPHDAMPEVRQAIEATRVYSDRFRRSEIADLLGSHRTGAERVAPEEAIRWLMERQGAPRALYEAGEQLTHATPPPNTSPLGNANTTRTAFQLGVTQEYQAVAQQAMQEAALQNPATAARQGAQAGVKFGNRVRQNIQDYAAADNRIATTNQELMDSVNRLNAFEKSAFNQYAQRTDPEEAIKSLLGHKNPRGAAQDMMARMNNPLQPGGRSTPGFARPDTAAISGFKNGLVEELRRESGGNMQKAYDLFQRPRYKNVFEEVFSKDEMTRMDRMLRLMLGAERGDKTTLERLANTGLVGAAGVAGITTGGLTAGALAMGGAHVYGRLAYPAALRRMFQNNMQKVFDREGADVLFSRALYDRNAEQVLLRKLPTVWRDAVSYSRGLGRMLSATQGALQGGNDVFKRAGQAQPQPTSLEYDSNGRRIQRAGIGEESASTAIMPMIDRMGTYTPGQRESKNFEDRRGFVKGRLLDLFRGDDNYDQGPQQAQASNLPDVSRTFREGFSPPGGLGP